MTTYEEIKTKILLMNEPWTDDDYLPRKVFELCQAENAELRAERDKWHEQAQYFVTAHTSVCIDNEELRQAIKEAIWNMEVDCGASLSERVRLDLKKALAGKEAGK